ncbi:MAG: helix-turn-helix transcriptional regulator [Pseudomonadota bacterium]|nr:helix-turn-helix transcriptional regulator [Pseudomonadota bacterium]
MHQEQAELTAHEVQNLNQNKYNDSAINADLIYQLLQRIEILEEKVEALSKNKAVVDLSLPEEVVEYHKVDGLSLIAAWRKHLGLTQKALADRLSVAQPTVAKFETAESVKISTLKRIAGALGIRYEQLC